MQPNTLYFGDNLQVLREQFPDESVDLVYLDPPFNSKRDYNYIYRDLSTDGATAQEQAFTDTWTMEGAAAEYLEVTESNRPEGTLIDALHTVFGDTSLVAYLSVMALRLRELHRVLKPTGSLYLHCDDTAGHYLKLVLDAVFGLDNYRNDVVWQRFGAHNDAGRFGRVGDRILFYRRSEQATFNRVLVPHSEEHLRTRFKQVDELGRRFWPNTCLAPGGRGPRYEWNGHTRNWRFTRENMQALHDAGDLYYSSTGVPYRKNYLDELEGQPAQDIWTDVKMTKSGAERLGYPTQKPLALLERIIEASSNPGDLCLDPFCGCGTAVAAAQKLGRQWCGIDITSLAVTLIRERLSDHFPEVYPTPGDVPVAGLPKDVASAQMLFEKDPYDFQFWALTLVGATPPGGGKKGADKGIDGLVSWHDGAGALQRAVVSVKGGKQVTVTQLKDLLATLSTQKAEVGLFVTLHPPTKPMKELAALAGEYELATEFGALKFPRLQLLTIEELLDGKRPALPQMSQLQGHKEAKAIPGSGGQPSLFGDED